MGHVRSHEHIQDDFRVCTHYGVIKRDEKVVCPVDETGSFTNEVTDFKGQYVKVTTALSRRSCDSIDFPANTSCGSTIRIDFYFLLDCRQRNSENA